MARNGRVKRYTNSVNALVDGDTEAFVKGETARRGGKPGDRSDVVRDMLDLARLAMVEGRKIKLRDGRNVLTVPLSD